MKWEAPKTGDNRILTKFTLFPITCKIKGVNKYETRWLCFVKIHQSYRGGSWINDWFE